MRLSPHIQQVKQACHIMMAFTWDLGLITSQNFIHHGGRVHCDLPMCYKGTRLSYSYLLPSRQCTSNPPISPDMATLVIDTGASATISPHMTMISSEHRNQRHCIMFADKSYVSYSYYNYFGAPQTLMSLCSGLYCLLLMPTPIRVHN